MAAGVSWQGDKTLEPGGPQLCDCGSLRAFASAVTNSCDWAVAFHSILALKEGLTPADVEAIREGGVPADTRLAALSALGAKHAAMCATMILKPASPLDCAGSRCWRWWP
ncbi:hypothetical protein RGR602_CH02811 [Rhizobium gallicum bv. gallicum R602sp]|uniref:Carboxymuconolactone decarboxylase-like domain-containing protein n=1 Tax=Rhizobium gallicum bv. gallicum R602sp TaxID=1041138 RepID=A0A0B4X2A9_9HYPH|nr:hypothetical protein RGR602_CH02811 [Rhizobium gallicum bv. gallicum R602sp]